MKPKLITTYVLSLFDLACTLLLVQLYGIGIEANPIGVTILQSPWGIAYKVIGVGVLLWVLYRLQSHRAARAGAWVVFTVYALLTAYHLAGLIYVWRVI